MVPLGNLVGLVMTGAIAAGVDSESPADCKARLETITYTQNGIVTVITIVFLLFFREKPPYPPSKMALTTTIISKGGVSKDFKVLAKNGGFVLVIINFTVLYGNFLLLGRIISAVFAD